jgi:hypothetical protein
MNTEILFAIAIALRREEEKVEEEDDRSAYSLLASVRIWRSIKYCLKLVYSKIHPRYLRKTFREI